MNKEGKIIEDLLPRLKTFTEETDTTLSMSSQESNDFAGDEESCDEISHDFDGVSDSAKKLEPFGRRNSESSSSRDFLATREYMKEEDGEGVISEKGTESKRFFQRTSRRFFSTSMKKGSSSPDLFGLADEEQKSKSDMSRIGSSPDLISELPTKQSLRRKNKQEYKLRIKRGGSSPNLSQLMTAEDSQGMKRAGSNPNLALSSRKPVGKASRTSFTGGTVSMTGSVLDGNDRFHSKSSGPLTF